MGHTRKNGLCFSKTELHYINWVGNESNYSKWITFEEMGQTCRNRPCLKKVVGLIKMG